MAAAKKGAKKKATPKKMGRPSDWNPALIPAIRILCEKGATDAELAVACGVTPQTINNWKKSKPEFFDTLKDAKAEADQRVERSLYERAIGYSHPSEKVFQYEGKVIRAATVEQYPPDTTAMIFWLKNRRPDLWRDKTEVSVNLDLAEAIKAARERAGSDAQG